MFNLNRQPRTARGALALALLFSLLLPPLAPATDILAHRGNASELPENTLAAVEDAWELGADAIEIDIHLSSDGEVVVVHDDDTKRVAGVDRKVCEQTFAELRALDVGRWKGERFRGARIPTLAEVLATVPDGRRAVVEIKVDRPGDRSVVPALEREMAASGLGPERFVVISFDLELLKEFKGRNPKVETCWLKKIRWLPLGGFEPDAPEVIETALAAGMDGVDVKAKGNVDAAFVRKVKEAGLRMYVYTVDDPEHARELIRAGVDGLTTNCPRAMLKLRAELE